MRPIIRKNLKRDLYLVETETNRILYIPKNWVDELCDFDEETRRRQTQAYFGNEDVLAYQSRDSKEWLTTDALAWFDLMLLDTYREVSEAEARKIDPDLFTFLDAVNSGEAA